MALQPRRFPRKGCSGAPPQTHVYPPTPQDPSPPEPQPRARLDLVQHSAPRWRRRRRIPMETANELTGYICGLPISGTDARP